MKRIFGCSALGVLMVLSLLAPAGAADPIVMTRDRSDNTMSFGWDSETSTLDPVLSSARIVRGDRVSFYVTIDRLDEASSGGERLKSVISLALNGGRVCDCTPRPIRYSGRFKLVIRDSLTNNLVLSETVTRNVTLRPRKGERRAYIRYSYDLPSTPPSCRATGEGCYTLWARFSSV